MNKVDFNVVVEMVCVFKKVEVVDKVCEDKIDVVVVLDKVLVVVGIFEVVVVVGEDNYIKVNFI